MGNSILDGYDKADFNKMLLLTFAPEDVEDDKPKRSHLPFEFFSSVTLKAIRGTMLAINPLKCPTNMFA